MVCFLGEILFSQIVSIPDSIIDIPGRESPAKYELVFKAMGIPALGFKSFYISSDFKYAKKEALNYKKIQLKFDKGVLTEIINDDKVLSLSHDLRYYKGNHHWTGAYIFRPVDELTYRDSESVEWKIVNDGILVTEYEQIFSDWTSQIIRIYHDEEYVEFDWLVGPIPTK